MVRRFIVMLVFAAPLYAADPVVEIQPASPTTQSSNLGKNSEWFFGMLVPYKNISGDFDGNRFYENNVQSVVVPSLDPAFGWGLVAGIKSRAYEKVALALELSYNRSRHSGQWAGGDFKSVHQELNIDLKLFGRPKEKLQPYALIGYSVPSVQVKDGAFANSGGRKDGTYHGLGLNLGAGLLYYVSDRFALHLQPTIRFAKYNELGVNDERGELNPALSTSEFNVQVGATFRFQAGH